MYAGFMILNVKWEKKIIKIIFCLFQIYHGPFILPFFFSNVPAGWRTSYRK